MIRFGLVFGAVLAVCSGAGAETAKYDHVHLSATDPAAAVEWYSVHMDGKKIEGAADRLTFGDVLVIFFKRDAGLEGSEGSSVDHIGFSFPDLDAKMKSYAAAGVKVLGEVREIAGKFKFGFVEDPWGTKIEVMEDAETLGFHHIHLRGENPSEILDWYQTAFGGERTKFKDMLDAVKYGPVWLLAQNSRGAELAGTKGRSLDHLGWAFPDLDAAAKRLKEQGVTFTMEPRPFRDLRIAFVEGPGGVSIELVQRPGG